MKELLTTKMENTIIGRLSAKVSNNRFDRFRFITFWVPSIVLPLGVVENVAENAPSM